MGNMDNSKIDQMAEEITFNQLRRLIGKTVRFGWIHFKENYSNELGDFENYKDVFLEELAEDLDVLDEDN